MALEDFALSERSLVCPAAYGCRAGGVDAVFNELTFTECRREAVKGVTLLVEQTVQSLSVRTLWFLLC